MQINLKKLCRSQVVEVKAVTDISNERAFNSPNFLKTYRKKVSTSTSMTLGSRKNAISYKVVAYKAMKGLDSNHGRSGRITASDRTRKIYYVRALREVNALFIYKYKIVSLCFLPKSIITNKQSIYNKG